MSNISLSFQPGTPLEYITIFELAGRVWSSYLVDDVTVNVHIDVTDSLPENLIGGALPAFVGKNYYEFAQVFEADITSRDDRIASSKGLPDNHEFIAGTQEKFQDYDTSKLTMTRANAKVLGQLGQNERANANALDGYILVSDLSNLEMNQDSDRSNDITWNTGILPAPGTTTLDLFSVALHELGHVLGFVSGTDRSSWLDAIQQLVALEGQALDSPASSHSSLFSSSSQSGWFSSKSSSSHTSSNIDVHGTSSSLTGDLLNAINAQFDSLGTVATTSPLDLYRFSDLSRLGHGILPSWHGTTFIDIPLLAPIHSHKRFPPG